MNLNGKTAVITGGASGIGLATAEALAAAGAHVFIGDIAEKEGEAVAAAIRGRGQKAYFGCLDVTEEAFDGGEWWFDARPAAFAFE